MQRRGWRHSRESRWNGFSDKPGEGLKVLNALRDEGVNLSAFVAFPKGRRAQLDFVPVDQAAFNTAAKKAKVRLIGPKTTFLFKGDEMTGSVRDRATKLSGRGDNITALRKVKA